jgi:hypothetical protein
MMVLALLALPLAASAQTTTTEPYSGGDVTETTIAPRIEVLANGLTATFTAVGAGGDCTWDFGDASTGTGNPTTHTYSAEGDYTVGVTCGTIVLARTLQVGADLTLTGIDVLPYLLGAFALILIGGLVVLANRRGKTAN